MRLSELDTDFVIEDLKLPGFDFHTLIGNKKGIWSIKFNMIVGIDKAPKDVNLVAIQKI